MQVPFVVILMLSLCLWGGGAEAGEEKIQRAYVEDGNNIHIVFEDGKETIVYQSGFSSKPKLAENRNALAWINRSLGRTLSSSLKLYRNNEVYALIDEPFVTDFLFAEGGGVIVVAFGSALFRPQPKLFFDVGTLMELDSAGKPKIRYKNRPTWSKENSLDATRSRF